MKIDVCSKRSLLPKRNTGTTKIKNTTISGKPMVNQKEQGMKTYLSQFSHAVVQNYHGVNLS